MLTDTSSVTERQALLRPAIAQKSLIRSVFEKCFFVVSDGQLMFMLIGLFILRLAAASALHGWVQTVVLTVKADFLFAILLVSCILCAGFSLANMRLSNPEDLVCNVVWICVTLTLFWYSMLKVSELHGLEVECWRPKHCRHHPQISGRPDLEGLNNVLYSWFWLPVGFYGVILDTLWRPVWLLFYVLPVAVVGRGPLNTIPWNQWREIIVGSVFWPFFIALGVVAAAIEEDRIRVVVLSMFFSIVFAAIPFYLTSDPVMMFWTFLVAPWTKVFHWWLASHAQDLQMPAEEWGALFVMIWWVARMLYVGASVQLEVLSARKRVEEGLRYALEHPFRADLEQGFACSAPSSPSVPGADPASSCSGSGSKGEALVGSKGGEEAAKSLDNKRQLLNKSVQDSTPLLPRRLVLRIRRSHLLEDSWSALIDKPVLELLAENMTVAFSEEMGSDAGGLTRDWFHAVATELVQGAGELHGSSLFATAPDGTLVPRPVHPEHDKDKFRDLLAAGRFLALAVYREQPLPVSFGLITCKHILGVPVGMNDVRQLDTDFYRGRVKAVLQNGGLVSLNAALEEPLTFMSAPSVVHPVPEPLKEGGADILVTDENKIEYVQLLCEAYLCSGIRREIQSFLQGFYALHPHAALRQSGVTPRELSLLISGIAILDPEDWRLHSYGGDTQVHTWFWELVRELNAEQRCMLLHFTTGSSRLPLGGFASLKPPFVVGVHPGYPGSCDRLPVAHTCANQLSLQEYESKAQLTEKLLMALSTDSFELV